MAEKTYYRCYGFQTRDEEWKPWRFAEATARKLRQVRDYARRARYILFLSAQSFPPPRPVSQPTYWRNVRDQYLGVTALPHYCPFYVDIDCAGDLGRALRLARWLVEWFTVHLELPEADCRVYFSGSKGFHLFVNPRALGIEASPHLTRHLGQIATRLCRRLHVLGAPDLMVDQQAYSRPRLLRASDQLHPKSKLYKIELYLRELLHMDIAHIKELATGPRGSLWDPGEASTKPVELAAQWWQAELQQVKKPQEFRRLTAEVTGAKVDASGFVVDELLTKEMPPCIEALWKSTLPAGSRNQGELQLACWAKAAGKDYDDALEFVQAWSRRNRPEESACSVDRHVQSVVKTVYEGAAYGFSCAAVRATGVQVDCQDCEAVAPRSLKNVASLRLSYDDTRDPPQCVPLCEARIAVANEIDALIRGQT